MPDTTAPDADLAQSTGEVAATAAPPRPAERVLGQRHVFGSYEAEFVAGEAAEVLVIALSGVRVGTPITGFDFYNGLTRRRRVDTLFLRDQKRSWYNADEGWDAVVALITATAAARPYRRVVVLGASMGAYGALLVGPLLPRARVVALAPPIGIDLGKLGRAVVRYKAWLDTNPPLPRPRPNPRGRERSLCLFGDSDVIDIDNARRFQHQGWRQVYMVPDGDHALAVTLLQRGRLDRFLDAMIDGAPPEALAAIAGAYAAHPHCQAFRILEGRAKLFRGALAAADACLEDARAAPPRPAALVLLEHLRLGLGPFGPAALARFTALPRRRHSLALEGGWTATLLSGEVVPIGPLTLLGPLAELQLHHPDPALAGRARIRLLAEMPQQPSRGGRRLLDAWWLRDGPPQRLASAPDPRLPLSVTLPLEARPDGAAGRVLLHRRSFSSGFEAGVSDQRQPWSIKLSGLAVETARG
ncbi:alpha/beta hydrolase [Pseudoroseomonas cervicalis]|uniref:Uncharacterized protein n=1 Tax=Pseudoroseomonas cervicalis ATCC 49957 TaxID=525371 RepID=D5RS66_9PROT|nr:alpha/beta hydrolase [Pseudoroseomonas cervicalis]EFH09854.1 hypothetical protein HMPREF0731_3928 [Pseudoroseomonas cervicalis ATCC 49957]